MQPQIIALTRADKASAPEKHAARVDDYVAVGKMSLDRPRDNQRITGWSGWR
jgi:hypothetical protein